MSAECHCRERAQNQGGAGKRLAGALAAVNGRWGVVKRDKESWGEREQRAAPEATAVAGSNWYTSQLMGTHTHRFSATSFPIALTSN